MLSSTVPTWLPLSRGGEKLAIEAEESPSLNRGGTRVGPTESETTRILKQVSDKLDARCVAIDDRLAPERSFRPLLETNKEERQDRYSLCHHNQGGKGENGIRSAGRVRWGEGG